MLGGCCRVISSVGLERSQPAGDFVESCSQGRRSLVDGRTTGGIGVGAILVTDATSGLGTWGKFKSPE